MKALLFLIDTLFTLLVVAFLLRLLMPLVRADFRNQVGQVILKATDPLVLPLRKVFPPAKRFDLASLVALLVVQFAGTALLQVVRGFPLRLGSVVIGGLYNLLIMVLQFYFYALLAYALLSWFAAAAHSPVAHVLGRICEPLLAPIRRVIPPLGGLDLSVLVAMLLLGALLAQLR